MEQSYVVSEIIKTYTNTGLDVRSHFSFYRDNNGKEIDLLIEENGILYPVEIKKSSDPGKDALKNFNVLSSLNKKIGTGAVICLSPACIPVDGSNILLPVSVL